MIEKFMVKKPTIISKTESKRSKSIAPKTMRIKKSKIVKTIGKNLYRKNPDAGPPMKIKLKLKEGMFNEMEHLQVGKKI
jgi:hypothetical protein